MFSVNTNSQINNEYNRIQICYIRFNKLIIYFRGGTHMRGDELFSKDCLNAKTLRKMDKEDLYSTYLCTLQTLQEYFYEDLYQKDEKSFRTKFNDLILNKGDFLRPIYKMLKKGMFDGTELPLGLAFIIDNQLKLGKRNMDNQIAELRNSNLSKEDIAAKIGEMNEEYDKIYECAQNVLDILCKRTVKKLKKMGMNGDAARLLAPTIPEGQYLDGRNFFFIAHELCEALYGVYMLSLSATAGVGKIKTSNLGVDLTNPESIKDIFNLFLKDADTRVMKNVVEQLLLDKKPRNFNTWSKEKVAVYNAITVYALETMESKKVFDNDDREEIIKDIMRRRENDAKNNRDAERRVIFSELAKDMVETYPRIANAWNKYRNK